MQIGTGSAHGTVLIFLLLLHFLLPISIPQPFPLQPPPAPQASSPLCLCRLSPIIVTTPHYLFFPTVALALFLYISLRGTRCVPRMIYSGADILAESVCCGQDALFPFRCLKMVPTLIADANELLYIYQAFASSLWT